MPKINLKHLIHFFFETLVWFTLAIFFVTLLVSFLSNSSLLGQHHLYIVQSGSMEPSIMTGDIIVTQSLRTYKKNDVITFTDPTMGIVTHRIVDINGSGTDQHFLTQGDANRISDINDINQSQIIGKVSLILPRLGYLVVFSHQPLGAIFLIGLPGLIIIIEEILKLSKKSSSGEKA